MLIPLILGAGTLTGFILYKKLKKYKENKIKTNLDPNIVSTESLYNNESNYIQKVDSILTNFANTVKNTTSKITNFIDSIPYIVFKRIHSITGIIFIGGFVIFHYINNSLAKNPKTLNKFTKKIHKFPLLPLIEIFGIYLPLTLHIIIGLILLKTSKINYNLKYETNYRFILQRLTAYIILFTLLFHLITIRFNEYLPDFIKKSLNIPPKRDYTFQKVNIWFKNPLRPIGLIIYKLFTLSVAYHLSNGLWTSAITWGLAKTYEKQNKLRDLSNFLFLFLSFWGLLIIHFYSQNYDFNNKDNKQED
jgi:succinate dehydrogenase / fumarate reductase cytochrome b subunit